MAQYMTCPDGGTFFICTNKVPGGFVGCCNATNACTPQGCGDGGLAPAGFDSSALGGTVWNKLHDQNCSTPKTFWSCGSTNPTFWGCCESDPCGTGVCPSGDLTPAFLSDNPADWSFFTEYNVSSQSTGSASKGGTDVGAIAGGAVGGFIFVVALVAGLWWFLKRKYTRQSVAVTSTDLYRKERYSGVPTLVSSNNLGSPAKGTFGSSPDPNQYSSESTPVIGGSSRYPSGVSASFWSTNPGYPQQAEPLSEPTWTTTMRSSQSVAELGGAPVYSEMPGQ